MGDFGIRVSQLGIDVNTAGTKDLLMDTSYPLLKVKLSGSGSLSISDGGSDSDTITHNLGYIPRILVYGQSYSLGVGKESKYSRYPYLETLVQVYYSVFSYSVNSTQLIISGEFFDESTNSDTFNYFYYIFYDEE